MFCKALSRYAILVLGFVLVMSLCIGLSGAIAQEEDDLCEGQGDGCIFGCPDDSLFTMDFRLEDCKFQTTGVNPFFILKPGYQVVLETPEGAVDDEGEEVEREKSVETVLYDTKMITLEDGRRINARVVEERAYELEVDEDTGEVEEKLIEISLNWFAICKKTNAVYYFGEWSRDCPAGFDEDDVCTGDPDTEEGESTEGSWEAGVDGAMAGLMMTGTPLLGSKYFQEIAEEQEAVDRGEIVALGLDVVVPAGDWSGCIKIYDTNPMEAKDGGCDGENDPKLYCPGVGLVKDQFLEMISFGYVGRDDDNDDDDDDDDHHRSRHHYWRWY